MKLRAKSVKRLCIILAVAAVSTGALTTVFLVKQHQRDAQLSRQCDAGLEAFASGDIATALPLLHEVAIAQPTNTKVLYAYAACRASDQTPNANLAEARMTLTQLLRIDPDNEPARRLEMKLLLQAGAQGDLLTSADAMLAHKPGDVEALRYRAAALSALNRRDEAAIAVLACADATPDDLATQLQALDSMHDANRPDAQIRERAQTLASHHADDDRMGLLVAEAQRLAGDDQKALATLQTTGTSERSRRDVAFTRLLVQTFDRLRAFSKSRGALDQAIAATHDPDLTLMLAQRLWQVGQYDAALKALPDNTDSAADAAQWRSVLHWDMGDAVAAQKDLQQLRDLNDADSATFLTAATAAMTSTPDLRSLKTAVSQPGGDTAIIHFWLANALANNGELDAAMTHWQRASVLMPSWPRPSLEASTQLLRAGRPVEAVSAALQSYHRAPQLQAVRVQFAVARYAALDEADDPRFESELLKEVESLCTDAPADPSLAAIHVGMLARSGQPDVARSTARAYLNNRTIEPSTASMLLSISQRYDLALDAEILKTCPTATSDADVVFLQARSLAASGDSFAARALLERAAGDNRNQLPWRLALARLAQRSGDTDAAQLWHRLGDNFAGDGSVQMCILNEARDTFAGDRAFLALTVDRLKAIVGEDSSRYRFEHARLLLESDRPEDAAEASKLARDLAHELPDRADIRLLLALALEKTDPTSEGALTHLRAAMKDNPRDVPIALNLVRMLERRGNQQDASAVLQRLVTIDLPDPTTRVAVVRAMLEADLLDGAQRILERSVAELSPAEKLQLAELYTARRDFAKAEPIYTALLVSSPKPDAALLASAASFWRQTGDVSHRDALLFKLSDPATPLDEFDRQLALALYHAQFAETVQARDSFAKALALKPDRAEVWIRSISLERIAGDGKAALAIAEQAATALPQNAELRNELAQLRVLAADDSSASGIDVPKLVASLQDDPNQQLKSRAIQLYADYQKTGTPTVELARVMAQLASAFPSDWPLQQRTCALCMEAGLKDQALLIAHRTADRLSASAAAQEFAAVTFRSMGQPEPARQCAARWRNLAGSSTRRPDELLADLALSDRRADEALRLLEPYRESILATPDSDAFSLSLFARATSQSKGVDAGTALLADHLSTSATVRSVWFELLDDCPSSQSAMAHVKRLLDATPADAETERSRIGGGLLHIAERFGSVDAARQAADLAAPYAQRSDAAPIWMLMRGEGLRRAGDLAGAEAAFRAVVQAHPDFAQGQNMLAYTLLQRNANLDEAADCANKAVSLAPGVADHLDTLARIELARSHAAEAERAFRSALQIDPEHLDALSGLGSLQLQRGQRAEAQATLARLDRIVKSRTRAATDDAALSSIPSHLRNELNTLRQGLSTTQE